MIDLKCKAYSPQTSQCESIDVYVPDSNLHSPTSKDGGVNSEYYESVLICKDIDIDNELKKARNDEGDDGIFKILSINFYDKRHNSRADNADPGFPKSERSNRNCLSVSKNEAVPNLKSSHKVVPSFNQSLHQNFFNMEKRKLMNITLAKLNAKQETNPVTAKAKLKQSDRLSFHETSRTSQKFLNGSAKPFKEKVSPRYTVKDLKKKDENFPRQQPFLPPKKETLNKVYKDSDKLPNSAARLSFLSKLQGTLDNLKITASKKNKQKNKNWRDISRPVVSENTPKNSMSPKIKSQDPKGKVKDIFYKPICSKGQLLQTLSNRIFETKNLDPILPIKSENLNSTGKTNGQKNSFLNLLESKRTTKDAINHSLIMKEMEKEQLKTENRSSQINKNLLPPRPSQRVRTTPDEDHPKAPTPAKKPFVKDFPTQSSKRKIEASHQESSRSNLEALEAAKFDLAPGILQGTKVKMRGISVAAKKNKEPKNSKMSDKEDYIQFYLKTKLKAVCNEKTKDTDSTNYKDSFVSLNSRTLEI